ncbi:hypothetical protein AB0H28_18045 [Micromonospora sp. NPDC050980]|uniref:hypothetical protein n=1 Tax=Micromonospora sp. NPDC050980 TaxID=3155161 RepID=UPI003402F701
MGEKPRSRESISGITTSAPTKAAEARPGRPITVGSPRAARRPGDHRSTAEVPGAAVAVVMGTSR